MCIVTRLHCQVCNVAGKYLFHPCKPFLEEHVNIEDNSPFPPGKHLYCPRLTWPLPKDEGTSHHICDWCLRNGVLYYQRTVAIEQDREFNERHHRLMYPSPVDSRDSHDLVEESLVEEVEESEDEEQGESNESSEVQSQGSTMTHAQRETPCVLHQSRLVPRATEVEGRFPPNWDGLPQRLITLVQRTHCRDEEERVALGIPADKNKAFEGHWQPRLVDEPYRVLTLWIPCCKVCKKPSFNSEGGIDGVEFEPSAIFWKWLKRLQGEKLMVTSIVTGFMDRPCDTCINLEVELRIKVFQFIQTCSYPACWAVWNWLFMRGRSDMNFWNHDAPNVGYSDKEAWDGTHFLRLMAEGWQAKSHVAWEDIVDLDPPISCQVGSYLNPTPFLDLSQWNEFAKVLGRAEPVVELPTPAALARTLPFREADLLMETQDISNDENSGSKTLDCPETPTVEILTLRQWSAKLLGKLTTSVTSSVPLELFPEGEEKRFFIARGAVIDEHGCAVKALDRARGLVSQQQEGSSEQTASSQTPANREPVANGVQPTANDAATDSAREVLKRKSGDTLSSHETKRARVEKSSANDRLSPSTAVSSESSPDTPPNSNSQDIRPIQSGFQKEIDPGFDSDDYDLFGDEQMEMQSETSPSPNGNAVAALAEGESSEAVKTGTSKPPRASPEEEGFKQGGGGFWYVKGNISTKDRWGFNLGVLEDEDDDGGD